MKNIIITLLFTSALILTFSPLAKAVVIIVDSTTDAIANDGHCTLREAIRAANNNTASSDTGGTGCPAGSASETDEIQFDSSTDNSPFCFILTGSSENAALTGDLDITQNLTITGNGSDKTIIDGGHRPSIDDPVSTCSTELGDRIFDAITGSVITINGVTVEGGNISGNGGGIRNELAPISLSVNNSIVQYNVVVGSVSGGGVYSLGPFTLNNSRITHNSVTNGSGAGAAGVTLYNTNSTITNSEISSNIIENSVNARGAGIYFYGQGTKSISIANTSIVGNSLINSAGVGGGLSGFNETTSSVMRLDLTSVTIAGNSADQGGGFWVGTSATMNVNILNTIIADNTATSSDSDCYNRGSVNITSAGHNIIENNCGIGLTDDDLIGDPGLLELADNGGPTYTEAFSADSIALNTGTCTNTLNSENISLDQRGVTRADGCDIGAFERISFYPDADVDTYGGPASIYFYNNDLTEQTDCDDNNAAIHPGVAETCDGIDDNCSGDENDASNALTWYADTDADGYGNSSLSTLACTQPSGYVSDNTDCNDNNPATYPLAPEICDYEDNNCDTTTDEGFVQGGDCTEGVGACVGTGIVVCSEDHLSVTCNAVAGTPTDELCGDSIDNDCDGETDEGFENVGDACTSSGVGACQGSGFVVCAEDGLSAVCNASDNASVDEICDDNIDNDCDGKTDSDDSDCSTTTGTCGDGTKDSGEACDDGTSNSDTVADACRSDCTKASCGDGVIDTGEECDDSGASDTCSAECKTITPTKKSSGGGGCSLDRGVRPYAPTGAVILFILFVPILVEVRVRQR